MKRTRRFYCVPFDEVFQLDALIPAAKRTELWVGALCLPTPEPDQCLLLVEPLKNMELIDMHPVRASLRPDCARWRTLPQPAKLTLHSARIIAP